MKKEPVIAAGCFSRICLFCLNFELETGVTAMKL